jgi:predicted nucleotidyltransferase component of viral defense system
MITQSIQDRPILRSDEEFSDLPADNTIRTYALEEISIEKTMALADRARNEPRDMFDLWHLTTNANVELGPLYPAIQAKLEFRGKPSTGLVEAIQAKEHRLEKLWRSRLGNQISTLPEFEKVFRELMRSLRRADFP